MTSYTFVSCVDSKVENLTQFYGRFQLGPFAPGQALTVANALRRSLLSQLSGLSITLVEIQGASNEYEVLNGVRESVLDILLNLKQIVLTSDFEIVSPQVGFLTVKGPGIVRSSDLKLPSFISIVDPNQYIATLSNSGRLTLKFLICSGKNYISYNSGSFQYEKWLLLLRQTQPFSQNFISNKVKKGDSNLEKLSTTYLNKKLTSAHLDPYNKSFFKQWIIERDSLNDSITESKPEVFHKTKISLNNQFNPNFKTKPAKEMQAKVVDPVKKLQNKNSKFGVLALTEGKSKLADTTNSTLNSAKFEKILTKNLNQSSKIGYFPIDAVFMPVTRVNYLIELNNFKELSKNLNLPKERIVLEIWTNGSVHPRHAIHKAAKSLIQLFLPLQQMRTTFLQPFAFSFNFEKKNLKKKNLRLVPQQTLSMSSKKVSDPKLLSQRSICENQKLEIEDFEKLNQILQLDIGNLDLSLRPYSCLKMANIHTINDLTSYSQKDLLLIPNFGQRSLVEVEEALRKMKLNLKEP